MIWGRNEKRFVIPVKRMSFEWEMHPIFKFSFLLTIRIFLFFRLKKTQKKYRQKKLLINIVIVSSIQKLVFH